MADHVMAIPSEVTFAATPPPGYNSNRAYFLGQMAINAYNLFEKKPLVLPAGWSKIGEFSYTSWWDGKTDVSCGLVLASSQSVVLSFRGTSTSEEMIAIDGDIVPKTPSWASNWYYIHAGFLWLYNEIRSEVLAILDQIGDFSSKSFYVTGHSLGGALATVFMADACVNFVSRYPTPTVYTFGSPRVGTYINFAQNYNNNMESRSFRVARPWDVVTMIPTLPYYHIDALNSLEGSIPNGSYLCHSMEEYLLLLNP